MKELDDDERKKNKSIESMISMTDFLIMVVTPICSMMSTGNAMTPPGTIEIVQELPAKKTR